MVGRPRLLSFFEGFLAGVVLVLGSVFIFWDPFAITLKVTDVPVESLEAKHTGNRITSDRL